MDQSVERWLPVVGYEGLYEVSDQGRVRGLPRLVKGKLGSQRLQPGKVLSPALHRNGYLVVILQNDRRRPDGKKLRYKQGVHRLVASAFLGECPEGMECCHINGIPSDNRVSNLRWDTRTGNQRDRVKHGTSNQGERCGKAKLTKDQAVEIRRIYTGAYGQKAALARRYGVTHEAIRALVAGKTWPHLA
jgi:hypothetical protein